VIARYRFLGAFFAGAPFSAPTSADTSNVNRTGRPARSDGILIARFDMATSKRNSRTRQFPSRVVGIARASVTKRSSEFQLYAERCTVRRGDGRTSGTVISCSICFVRVHLITAESPESRRLRRGRLIQFPQLTMPLIAALTPREHSVSHTDEIVEAVRFDVPADTVSLRPP